MRITKRILVFCWIGVLFGCSKSEYPNLVGTWEGVEVYEFYINDVIQDQYSRKDTFVMKLNSDESGEIIYPDGSMKVIEWDLFFQENRIILFEVITDSLGQNQYKRINDYEVVEDTKNYQEWLYSFNTFNFSTQEDFWAFETIYLRKN